MKYSKFEKFLIALSLLLAIILIIRNFFFLKAEEIINHENLMMIYQQCLKPIAFFLLFAFLCFMVIMNIQQNKLVRDYRKRLGMDEDTGER